MALICRCEHARHFPDNSFDIPADGHAYSTPQETARPASVRFQFGEEFCDDCLKNCHPGEIHLGD